PFAQADVARLEELRLQALEERIEADLALGRHESVVPELETLVGEHSVRERLCRQLMIALYRSGRQAEALAAYANARRTLSDELGLEPGHDLRALERAILRQDASLELPRAYSESTKPARGTFVGRQGELETLVNGFAEVHNGHSRVLLILDDLHAADAPSLLLLHFVARELADARLLLLGAYRDVDPTIGGRLGGAVSELVREPVTTRIALSGLTQDDIAAYIEVAAGSRPHADVVGAIHDETEANPLFV